jgi:DNA ligase (NAD+)
MDFEKTVIANLIDIKDYLEKENYEKANEKLEAMKINTLVNFLVYKENFTEDDKIVSGLVIRILQNIYNNGGDILSPITDELYDKLYERNKEFEEVVGATINKASTKIIGFHKYPDLRGTLDKVHFIEKEEKGKDIRKSLEEWMDSIRKKCATTYAYGMVMITPKFDGVSVIFECEDNIAVRALSRGDTEKNEAVELAFINQDIKINFIYENDLNFKKFGVKTEVIMNGDDFKKFKKKYGEFKSPRSAVSSILNSKEFNEDMLKYLTIIPLQLQDFETKAIIIPKNTINMYAELYDIFNNKFNPKELKSIFETFKNAMEEDKIPIDGVVIRCSDEYIINTMGRENNINKFEIAYKFPPEQKKTFLKDVVFSVGILGAITPVAVVDPVKIKGNTITNISLGSMDRFKLMNLHYADEVIIKYDVIPYLDVDETCFRSNKETIKAITNCPYCDSPLIEDPILKCVNETCDSRVVGKIINYLNKMRIMNISTAIVETFYKEGYLNNIKDLYTLKDKKKKLYDLKGFGKKSIDRIIDSINARKDVYDYELFGSIGIADIGQRMFKKILNIYYVNDLKKVAQRKLTSELTQINGVGEKVAKKIIEGILLNEDLIEFLCSELNVKRSNSNFKGKVCFTKIRDKELEKVLLDNNIESTDTFSKDIMALIVPDYDVTSSKIEKAKKYGIKIISLEDIKKSSNLSVLYDKT